MKQSESIFVLFVVNLTICFAGSLWGSFSNGTGNYITQVNPKTGQFVNTFVVDLRGLETESDPLPLLLTPAALDFYMGTLYLGGNEMIYSVNNAHFVNMLNAEAQVIDLQFDLYHDQVVASAVKGNDLVVIGVDEQFQSSLIHTFPNGFHENVYWAFAFSQKKTVLSFLYYSRVTHLPLTLGQLDLRVSPPRFTSTPITNCALEGRPVYQVYDDKLQKYHGLYLKTSVSVAYFELEGSACNKHDIASLGAQEVAVTGATFDPINSLLYFSIDRGTDKDGILLVTYKPASHTVLATAPINSDNLYALVNDIAA